MTTLTQTALPAARTVTTRTIVKGLLWREWLAHSRALKGALAAWLIGVWVLEIFYHPVWILGFGVFFAMWTGQGFGGSEAAEGAEEFSFALPPKRAQRYLVKMTLGLACMILFVVGGLLAIGLDLPQKLWGLVVQSGMTRPYRPAEGYWYAFALGCPLAVFSFSFTFAAVSASRAQVSVSWVFGTLATGALVGGCLLLEWQAWHEFNALLTLPVLLAICPAILLVGYLAYLRKEGISRPAAMQGIGWVFGVLLAGALAIILIALLLMVTA